MAQPSKKLIATVGTTAAFILMTLIPKHEGTVLRGYRDPVGIVTACVGHTKTAELRPYTQAECDQLLDEDLIYHAEGVLHCTPGVKQHAYPLAAAISFTFNVGVTAYCQSTMARKFNADDYEGACAEFSRWVKAGGRVFPGLVTRRAEERAICEEVLQDPVPVTPAQPAPAPEPAPQPSFWLRFTTWLRGVS